jgi:hypothetical protein
MAEVSYSIATTDRQDALITWANVTEADTFQTFALDKAASEISVHIKGTFGGATVSITGSNDAGVSGPILQQIGGNNASATVQDIFSVLDRPLEIKPTASGGTSQSVTVLMLVRY